MKKLLFFAAMLISISAMAQQPVITFNETTHDFGKINEADGRVTTIFVFKNEGMIPLILSNVKASCGCTTPKWTKEPIEPGATGEITVTYNPNGRPGRFQKSITVTSNATEPTVRLNIKGEVIPKPVNPAEKYPVKMGVLNLKQKSWNFGILNKKDASKTCSIEYTNTTNEPINIGVATTPEDQYLKTSVTLPVINPGETGKINITLNIQECPIWGPIEPKLYVIVNGERIFTDEYAIKVKADIREDFSAMTAEQMQQAPILSLNTTFNAGAVKEGKKLNTKITFTNLGLNPLHVRRIVCNDANLSIVAPKTAIKGGKKYDANITINALGLEPGNYSRTVTVITNDPKKSVLRLIINWVVE